MSSTQEKPSDVISPNTGKPLYGAAAESVKGNLKGAAAASAEGKLQGAAAEAHAQKQERDAGHTGYTQLTEENTKPYELHGAAAEAKKGHLLGAAAEAKKGHLMGAAAEAHADKERGESKKGGRFGDESGVLEEGFLAGEDVAPDNPEDEDYEPTPEEEEAVETDTVGLQGAAAEARKQKVRREGGLDAMEAKETRGTSPGRGFDRQGNLIGAAKAAHEAKMQREAEQSR